VGKSPKGQSYSVGCGVAMLQPAEEYLNVDQARAFLRLGIRIMDSESGVRSESEKASIGICVGGNGSGGATAQTTNMAQDLGEAPAAALTLPTESWKGFWVPFQNHGHDGLSSKDRVELVKNSAHQIGQGCDKVILFKHGGGFMDGNARMYLSSPHYSPLNATSLAGLPPTLVFVGGVEIFRLPTEIFVERARRDGVQITLEVGEGRSHDYLMVPQICPYKEISAGHEKIAAFMKTVSSAE